MIENLPKSKAAGRGATRNRHVQKLVVPILHQAEARTKAAIPEKAGNKLQQVIIGDKVEHVTHMRFPIERSRDIPVVPDRFRTPLVFECEALLPQVGANRHNRVVILRESKSGQLILRADLHRTDPSDKQSCPNRAQMNVVESDRMENTSLGFLSAKPATPNQTILPHPLQQSRGAARDGVHKLTRAI